MLRKVARPRSIAQPVARLATAPVPPPAATDRPTASLQTRQRWPRVGRRGRSISFSVSVSSVIVFHSQTISSAPTGHNMTAQGSALGTRPPMRTSPNGAQYDSPEQRPGNEAVNVYKPQRGEINSLTRPVVSIKPLNPKRTSHRIRRHICLAVRDIRLETIVCCGALSGWRCSA